MRRDRLSAGLTGSALNQVSIYVGQAGSLRRTQGVPRQPAWSAGNRGTLWVARSLPSCPTIEEFLAVLMPRTIIEKLWDSHIVHERPAAPTLLFIDLHLVHEVTSPQAFQGLRDRGL